MTPLDIITDALDHRAPVVVTHHDSVSGVGAM